MEEIYEDNEAQLIEELLQEFLQFYNESNPPDRRPARRGTHPKTIALTRAEFSIEPNLPSAFRVGLFKESKTYPAYVRFSQTFPKKDTERDNRSLSIKILLPDGTQDFLMRSTPTFYVRTIREFYELLRNRKNPLKFFFPSINPLRWRLKQLWLITSQNRRFKNLLSIPYYGEVPFLFGDRAMKFMLAPQGINTWEHSIPRGPRFLHDAIKSFLKTREARFDFMIQFQTDLDTMPIEDATSKWNSPFYKVATLRLPSQEISDEEDEELSFNPWHALPEHRPLGGINRARREIYKEISRLRHERNQIPEKEPTD